MKEWAEKYRKTAPTWSEAAAPPPVNGCDGKELVAALKKRFDLSSHPAMVLGHLMDLRFLCKDEVSGKYKPDMGASTAEEMKKAAALAARLTDASAEVELQRWIIDGHQDSACATLIGTVRSAHGMEVAAASTRDVRVMWEGSLKEKYPQLARIAARIFALHATSCATERLWSLLRWVYDDRRSRLHFDKARKMAIISMYRRSMRKENCDDDEDLLLESFVEEETVVIE